MIFYRGQRFLTLNPDDAKAAAAADASPWDFLRAALGSAGL